MSKESGFGMNYLDPLDVLEKLLPLHRDYPDLILEESLDTHLVPCQGAFGGNAC